jgi:flagellar biosynthetic protein FlhB
MSDTDDRDNKTEDATEKRISDSMAKGRVPYTREIPLFLTTFVIWIAVSYLLTATVGQLGVLFQTLWDQPHELSLGTRADVIELLGHLAVQSLTPLLPLFGLMTIAGVVGTLAQSRGLFLERIKPQLSRISPKSGWQRLFGKQGLAHNIKSTAGLLFVAVVASSTLALLLTRSLGLFDTAPATLLVAMPSMASDLLAAMLSGMLVVAALDIFLTRLNWRRGLRMSKKEITDETKDVDGDPLIKMRMRLLARRRARKRMLAAVPSATVVITNPTHYAVALRFVRGETPAPIVVAKGVDHLALKIRETASDHGKPIVEDRPLARALYSSVAVDGIIPPELYKAVARVIMFVESSAKPPAAS